MVRTPEAMPRAFATFTQVIQIQKNIVTLWPNLFRPKAFKARISALSIVYFRTADNIACYCILQQDIITFMKDSTH